LNEAAAEKTTPRKISAMNTPAIRDETLMKAGRKRPTMKPGLRKLILTVHITSSVGWLGAVAGFLALAIAALNNKDAQTIRAAYIAMALMARFVIVPLAFASLLSGIIQALGTPWGLFRHYWLLVKLLLTLFATVILLLKTPLISYAARQAAAAAILSSTNLHAAGRELLVHSAGGLLVLVVVTTLSVYKPWGLTRYGRRKLREQGVELAEG
jgi:Predicted integral membrane protein (DUF2269).